MKLYTFKDNKLGAFDHPVISVAVNDEVICRSIQTSAQVNQLPPIMLTHPDDFELYCVGELDQATGSISACCDFIMTLKDIIGGPKNG